MRSALVMVSAIIMVACGSLRGEAYEPPAYPQTEPALGSIRLQGRVLPGGDRRVELNYTLIMRAAAREPRRLFAYFVHQGRVLHVAVFPAIDAPGLPADTWPTGREVTAGPFIETLPADLPSGTYEVRGGMYLEKEDSVISLELPVSSVRPRPLIITTGRFLDKHGVPHRWHISRTHTCFWDGEPWIPVGGMFIPDRDFDTFRAQIDLLRRSGVRDIYWNVGSSVMIPHTWGAKSEEDLRLFQKCIDYMDEAGMRYGMQCSGLQARDHAWDLMGGPTAEITVGGDGEWRMANAGEEQWLDGRVLCVARRRIREAVFVITDAGGRLAGHGRGEIVRDPRPDAGGRPRDDHHHLARMHLPDLPPGEYRVHVCLAWFRDGWNDNMFYWSEETPRYFQAVRDLYSRVRMGPGFRLFIDVYWNENNFNHGIVPVGEHFAGAFERYLQERYGTIDRLGQAWQLEDPSVVPDFAFASRLLPVRVIREEADGTEWTCLYHLPTDRVLRCRFRTSQQRYDLMESISRQVRDFHIQVANVFKELHDVPVVFKFFSGVDHWHINDAGIADGHDGVGMETYGVGEPMLTFMGVPPFSSCAQATKTMWLIATEIGEGNHQDQALERNKMLGYTSRLGTAYPSWSALLAGGARGLFSYYMSASPGVERLWEETLTRDPRQLEWLGTFARIVQQAAPRLTRDQPTVYYRFPALLHPNSGLTVSDMFGDYHNSDTLWFVDPAGKLPNGAWILPIFTLQVPTEMMFINLEDRPASARHADQVEAFLAAGQRVTWLGFRRDLGTFPAVDRYYTATMSQDDDGVEIQVLKPTPTARVIASNRHGEVWNLIDGQVQIISKSAAVMLGYRPQQVVLDGRDHRYDYRRFMKEVLGVERAAAGGLDHRLEAFSFQEGDRRVTVLGLRPPYDSTVRLGDQLPPFSTDATGNVVPPAAGEAVTVSLSIPAAAAAKAAVVHPDGTETAWPADGALTITLTPDDRTLIRADRSRFPYAPEGILFDTAGSRATVILHTPADVRPIPRTDQPVPRWRQDGCVWIEGEQAVDTNFNLGTFSSLPELSGDAFLGLATAQPPPSPDGYFASYEFETSAPASYVLWVREGYQAMASPGRWQVDDGLWQQGSMAGVPVGIRLVAQYNALEDERMIFAWYRYGSVTLKPGRHRLTYSVLEKRPGGLDIGLANKACYGKLIDCLVLAPVTWWPEEIGRPPEPGPRFTTSPRNLVCNPSMEQDIGGWEAAERVDGRWKQIGLCEDAGHHRDFWWTRRLPGEGRLVIPGLMDVGGLQVRQSYVGVRSLRIRAGSCDRRFSGRPFAVRPGDRLVAGGFLRGEALEPGACLRLQLYDGRGRPLAAAETPPVRGTTLWTAVRTQALAADSSSETATIEFFLPSGSGTAWCDDVYVYRE